MDLAKVSVRGTGSAVGCKDVYLLLPLFFTFLFSSNLYIKD